MIQRHLTQILLEALADSPVVLVNGARQTGKSTMVHAEPSLAQRQYLTFDDPGVLTAARNDPNGFVAGLGSHVTLDEIQHVPELFSSIKLAVDRQRHPGRFLLTGSANVLLLPKLSESLAGRMEILTLWPFSQGEVNGTREAFIDTLFSPSKKWPATSNHVTRGDLLAKALAGGYPVAFEREPGKRRDAWFHAYLTTMLQRDVRDIAEISDLTTIPRLLSVVAGRAGGLLNYADLSRSLALPQTTLKRYFALLETTFLVQLLRPWHGNLGQRTIQAPKVYLNDSGLLAHLIGLKLSGAEFDHGLAGCVFENFALMELRKQAAWSDSQPQIYFWRTASGQEVDIVLEDRSGRMAGIEVKASSTLNHGDSRGLQALAAAVGKKWTRGVILYTGAETIPFGENLHGLPLSRLWEIAE